MDNSRLVERELWGSASGTALENTKDEPPANLKIDESFIGVFESQSGYTYTMSHMIAYDWW